MSRLVSLVILHLVLVITISQRPILVLPIILARLNLFCLLDLLISLQTVLITGLVCQGIKGFLDITHRIINLL